MTTLYDSFQGISARKTYHPKTALSLAVACLLAYEEKAETVKAVTQTWGFSETEVVSRFKGWDIDFQGYITKDDNNILIAVRGSDKATDWFTNFQAVTDPGPFSNTKAHEGFQDALFPAVISLSALIEKFRDKQQRLWITGHSLGGAQCSLFAGMLIENGYDVYGVYTFASPRPGNASFAEQLNKRVTGPHYRVVNSGDLVPHVPPEPFFSHPGSRRILKNTRTETSSKSWMAERIAAIGHFVKMTGNAFDIADNHTLTGDNQSYIPKLQREVKRMDKHKQKKGKIKACRPSR